jgi:hypothetical protein
VRQGVFTVVENYKPMECCSAPEGRQVIPGAMDQWQHIQKRIGNLIQPLKNPTVQFMDKINRPS